MTRNIIDIDLDSCIGCHSCAVVCKQENNVGLGTFYNKVLTVGPSGTYPDLEMYYLPVSCQHCDNPECVSVCPTGASYKRDDGVVLVDHSKCIGCQYCVMACPYGVRYLNEEEKVVEKCTLCEQKLSQGELPQCVSQCGGNARWIGDTEAGYESFEGSEDPLGKRRKMVEFLEPFTDADVHKLPDVGNKPSYSYILRDHHWEGGDELWIR